MKVFEHLLTLFERDDVFYPAQVVIVPALIFAAALVYGGGV